MGKIAKGTNRIFHKICWEGYVRMVSMQLVAEQEHGGKKQGKPANPEENASGLQERISIANNISGDHPYRRRKL